MLKNVRVNSLHQIDIVLSQLERSLLKTHIARWTWYHKTEIYMDNVTVNIDKYVIIMPIFDVEKILN